MSVKSVEAFERQQFGEPLTTVERVFGGLIGLTAALANAALGTAAAVFFYVLLFGL